MSFTEAIRGVLSRYATFSGRAVRSEYWWWALFVVLLNIGANVADEFFLVPALGIEPVGEEPGAAPLSILVALGLLLPNLAVGVRRLHDIDRSGWWLLIGLVPIVGVIVLIWWFVQRGTQGPNRFGLPDQPQDARL